MKTAVIVATYNKPESLRMCLYGLLVQSQRPDQVIVADDGSRRETHDVIGTPEFSSLEIKTVTQQDNGWRKNTILNLAMTYVTSDYVVFLDGDCIPRRDFVEKHCMLARPRCYLSGGRVDVGVETHCQFRPEDILENRIFDIGFLTDLDETLQRRKYRLHPGRWEHAFNLLTYRYAALHGSNASAWTDDILRVNGFNEGFSYGSDDREFGARLHNAGVRSRWLKFSLCQIHLSHPSKVDPIQQKANRKKFRRTFLTRVKWCEPGIDTAAWRAEEANRLLARNAA